MFNYTVEHLDFVVIVQKSKHFTQKEAATCCIHSTQSPGSCFVFSLALRFLFQSEFVNQFPLPIQTWKSHIPAYFIWLFALQRGQAPCKWHFKLPIFCLCSPQDFFIHLASASWYSNSVPCYIPMTKFLVLILFKISYAFYLCWRSSRFWKRSFLTSPKELSLTLSVMCFIF